MFFLPIAIAALAGGAFFAAKKRPAGMTAERQVVYETALKTVKDPDKLTLLSDEFRKQGLTPQADMLAKRAALRKLPASVKSARRDAFKKGMASKDPQAIETLAASFEHEGATGAAKALHDYAQAVRSGHPAAVTAAKKAAVVATPDHTNVVVGLPPPPAPAPAAIVPEKV